MRRLPGIALAVVLSLIMLTTTAHAQSAGRTMVADVQYFWTGFAPEVFAIHVTFKGTGYGTSAKTTWGVALVAGDFQRMSVAVVDVPPLSPGQTFDFTTLLDASVLSGATWAYVIIRSNDNQTYVGLAVRFF